MPPISVSVVITTYNDAHFLERSVTSVLRQTVPVSEIIIVDDGSNDNLAHNIFATLLVDSSVDLRFFRKKNGGPSSARNFGLSLSTSDFVAFLDADDYWLPENLAHKLILLETCESDCFGVYGSFIDSRTEQAAQFASTSGSIDVAKIGRKRGFPGGAPSYLFRRTALEHVGGFDESLSFNEDFDLVLRLIKSGFLCRGDSRPGFFRNQRVGSHTRRPNPESKHRGIQKFLIKSERIGTLPIAEIRRRRKDNDLEFAKGLRASKASANAVKTALANGFSVDSPRNLKECAAFLLLQYLRLVTTFHD